MNNLINSNSEVDELLNSVKVSDAMQGAKREARIIHERFLKAASLGKGAAFALRRECVSMFLSNGFLDLEVEYDNDPSQKLSFGDFSSWLNYAIEKVGLENGALTSTLNSLMKNIIDPVSKSLVDNPATGKPFDVQDILLLKEGVAQKISSAARSLLNDKEKSDDEKRETLSEIISAAQTNTTEDLVELLRDYNLSQRRTPQLEVNTALLPDGSVAYQFIVSEVQDIQAKIALRGRANIHTRTVDDLMDELRRFIPKSDDDVDENDFEKFIESVK